MNQLKKMAHELLGLPEGCEVKRSQIQEVKDWISLNSGKKNRNDSIWNNDWLVVKYGIPISSYQHRAWPGLSLRLFDSVPFPCSRRVYTMHMFLCSNAWSLELLEFLASDIDDKVLDSGLLDIKQGQESIERGSLTLSQAKVPDSLIRELI
jgi:hypothetical protein